MKKLTVKLTYFKRRGKFYDEGTFEVDSTTPLWEIWDMVKKCTKTVSCRGLFQEPGSHSSLSTYLDITPSTPGFLSIKRA